MKKGQVTIEFVLIATFMLFVFGGVFLVLQTRMGDIRDAKNMQVLNQLGNVVSTEVEMAAQVGEGYERNFSIPQTLQGEPYTISIQGNRDLVISYGDLDYIRFLPAGVQGGISNQVRKHSIQCCSDGNVTISPVFNYEEEPSDDSETGE